MKKQTKISLYIALGLITLGIILAAITFILNFDDPLKTFSRTTETTYSIDDTFDSISVKLGAMNVELAVSDTDESYVVFKDFDNEKTEHTAEVRDGTLVISRDDNRAWYEYINITIGEIKVTLYLSESEFEKLTMNMSSGNIKISDSFEFTHCIINLSSGNVSFDANVSESLRIKTSSGNIYLSGVDCGLLNVNASSGNVKLDRVLAEYIQCTTSSGNISLTAIDADTIRMTTSSGNIRGSVASEKTFQANTASGKISVPDTSGGLCELKTGSGNIKITIE